MRDNESLHDGHDQIHFHLASLDPSMVVVFCHLKILVGCIYKLFKIQLTLQEETCNLN